MEKWTVLKTHAVANYVTFMKSHIFFSLIPSVKQTIIYHNFFLQALSNSPLSQKNLSKKSLYITFASYIA